MALVSEELLGLAALGLLGVPLSGAVLVWLLPRLAAERSARASLTILTVALIVGGLAAAVLEVAARSPTALSVPLGPAGPGTAVGSTVWTLAPAVLSVLFVVIALRARSLPLIGLALLQAIVVAPATAGELMSGGSEGVEAALRLDPLALALLLVSTLVGGAIVLYSLGYEPAHLEHTGGDPARTDGFIAWLFVFLAAMHLLVLANDLRLLAVGWEITTLCSYVLIGFDRTPAATVAARRALAYNLLGGAALAVGAWIAGPHATLGDVLARPESAWLPVAVAAFALAAATKSALAPFHPWLLGAMVAAAPVSALLHASTMVKAGSYLLLRLSPVLSESPVGLGVALIGAFSFAMAALLALRERDLKRVLALSTVASLGLIAAAAGLGSPVALAAGVVFLVLHGVAKGLAFLVVGATEQATGTRDLETLVGLARVRPRLAAPLILAAAAMALPPFGIAAAKWALLLAGSGELPVVLLLAIGAAANVALWTAVVGRMLVRRPVTLPEDVRLAPSERLSIAALAGGTAAGLVLAGPLAAALGDPSAAAAFGQTAGLGDGWDLAALGGTFPVPAIVVVGVAVLLDTFVIVRRRVVSVQPYLGGTNVDASQRAAFHGARGESRMATSGGFYWGAALGDPTGPFGLRRFVAAGGWLAVIVIAVAAALQAAGWSR